MKLNSYIDHTLLKNTSKTSDFNKLIEEGNDHEFFSLCVPPSWVSFCMNKNIKICSVAGFPFGYSLLKSKLKEIEQLFEIGCDEVDVVLNYSALKSGDWTLIADELKEFHNISKSKKLKVIVESGMLLKKELEKLCDLFNKHPSTFIKTSTGFMEKGAILDQVRYMRSVLDQSIKIKASGGIKNQKQAFEFINAGADRLGTSASVTIVTGEIDESCSTY